MEIICPTVAIPRPLDSGEPTNSRHINAGTLNRIDIEALWPVILSQHQ